MPPWMDAKALSAKVVAGIVAGCTGCGAAPPPATVAAPAPEPVCPAPPSQEPIEAAGSPAPVGAVALPERNATPGAYRGVVRQVGPTSLLIEIDNVDDLDLDDTVEARVFAPAWLSLGRIRVRGVGAGTLRLTLDEPLPEEWEGLGEGAVIEIHSPVETADKNCCKGMNECKGMGYCKTERHDCAGKNECKGRGGCKPPNCA